MIMGANLIICSHWNPCSLLNPVYCIAMYPSVQSYLPSEILKPHPDTPVYAVLEDTLAEESAGYLELSQVVIRKAFPETWIWEELDESSGLVRAILFGFG